MYCCTAPMSPPNPYQFIIKLFNCLIWVTFGLYIIWICIKEERWRHFLKFYREMTSGVKVKVKKVKKILSLKSTRNCPICIENWKKNFWIFFHTKMKKLRIFYHMRCSFFLSPWTFCMGNNKTACNLSLGDCFQLSIDSPHVLDDLGHFSFFDLFWPWWPWFEKNLDFKLGNCSVYD